MKQQYNLTWNRVRIDVREHKKAFIKITVALFLATILEKYSTENGTSESILKVSKSVQ